jgi:plastocyanin
MRLSRSLRIAVWVIAIAALAPGVTFATSQSVVIQDFAFAPKTATINAGESVTWLNIDAFNHTATSDNGAFDTGAIPAGGNKTVSFSLAGSYAYHCSIHPTMKGTILVVGPTATPAPATPAPSTPVPSTPRPAPPTIVPTVRPTASPSPSPSPSPSASASPSPSATATAAPTAAPTQITVPTSVAAASPSAAGGPGPDLGSGPGPLIAAGGLALAVGLGGLAFYLYRRR